MPRRFAFVRSSSSSLAARFSAILTVAAGVGCTGESSGTQTIRTDSAGVQIVSSPGPDRPLAWTLEPIARVGGAEDGPESFTEVGTWNFGADGAGNLYVMDRHTSRVVVFDADGSFVREMGSEGAGPGELQFPIGFSVSPSGIASVFDVGKRALVEFGPAGELLPQVPFPHSTEPGIDRFYQRTDAGFTVAKGFGGIGERDVELVSWGAGAPSADTVRYTRLPLPTPEMVDFGCMGLALQPFFTPVIQWAASPAAVAVIGTAAYEIDVYAPEGSLVRSVRRDVAPRPATRALALAEAGDGMSMQTGAGLCEASGERVVEGRGYAQVVPTLRNVIVAPDGELWVERWEPGARHRGGFGPIDVFDPGGAYLGTLPAGTPFPLAILAGGRIVVSETDALDVDRMVVMRVDR